MTEKFHIEHINTENIKNPISTFNVTGESNGIHVNEIVVLDIEELNAHTSQKLDVLSFLELIQSSKENFYKSPIYPLLTKKAYEKSYKNYKKLQTLKLMMTLSKKKKSEKGILTTYDKNGKINRYNPQGISRLDVFR